LPRKTADEAPAKLSDDEISADLSEEDTPDEEMSAASARVEQ
jgi:hypothetical protein